MPKNLYTVLLMFIALSFGTTAHAEIFKWTDANGITHYSDSASTSRPTQTLDFGELRRPAAPRTQLRETRKFFPGQVRKVKQRIAPQRPRVRHKAIQKPRKTRRSISAKQPRTFKAITHPTQEPLGQQFKEFQLVEKPELMQSEPQPDLNAKEYDLRHVQKKTIKSVKQTLCSEKRMLLAALQEKGFDSYLDEEGHYRVAWGGDGIYQGKRRFLNQKKVAKKTSQVLFEVEQYCDNPFDLNLQKVARANWIRAEYCKVSKAVLEDLEHPFMRATDRRIKHQTEEVERLCSELKTNQYLNDKRYYPVALEAKVSLPRYLTVKEDEASKLPPQSPQETLEQLLALIQ